MRRFLAAVVAYLVGLVLACDLTVLGVRLLDRYTSLLGRDDAPAVEQTGSDDAFVPGPGQAFLQGDIDRLVADGAEAEPLASPFTITALERGEGNVTIEKALVQDKRVTISWSGGTPLPITGAGSLELGAARVEVDASGVSWRLEGTAGTLTPGEYRAGASVAVGGQGIAAPRDSVDFTADEQTVVTAEGGVIVKGEPKLLQLSGAGAVTATGRLELEVPEKRGPVASVEMAKEGLYQLTVTPSGTALRVDGILQGPLRAREAQ